MRSKAKMLRDKRRLLSFLIRMRQLGKEVSLDYWKLLEDLKSENPMDDQEIDSMKHTEQRFFSLVATVQRSNFTPTFEETFFLKLLAIELKCTRNGILHLTSNQTRLAENGLFTHRYLVNIILKTDVNMPCDYIWRRLKRDSFEYENGRRIFFKNNST